MLNLRMKKFIIINYICILYTNYLFTQVPSCPVICCFPLSNCLIILDNPKSEILIFVLSVGLSIFSVRRILNI